MLIPFNKEDYEVVTTHETCPFHKKHPGESYAGCTCSGSYGLKRKPVPEVKTKPKDYMRKPNNNEETLGNETPTAMGVVGEETGLAPCPFCGSSWINIEQLSAHTVYRCAVCTAQVWLSSTSALNAHSLWNKRTPSPQPQVAEGKEEPVACWIETAKQPPTKEDADIWGNVFVADDEHGREGVDVTSLDNATTDQWPFWMPIPPVPVEGQQKDLGER